MRLESFRRLAVFMVAALLVVTCVTAGAAQTQGDVSTNAVDKSFHKARENFLKKDFKDAASEIRQAAGILAAESSQAMGQAKQDLTESARELNMLAGRVEKKAVKSDKELDNVFARAEHSLAQGYEARGSESWAKKEISEAGRDLRSSANHLENTLAWAGQRIEEKSGKAIRDARDLAGKMESGIEVAGSEVDNAFEAIRKEIDAVARKYSSSKGVGSTAISVAGKSEGPVDLSSAIIRVARQVMPAVVYIEVTESQIVENPFHGLQNDPFFRRFFGIPKMPPKFKQELKGLGSGMIIDAQGSILTNYHVAGNATKMEVTLADGSRHPAKLVGGDSKTDLAVIRISAGKPLPYVTFGDSDSVEVGEWVVAIGAPRALEKSVTQGIISAKHRSGITDPEAYQDFLQADAPINPGNSGGPLLNLHGQVIGVNAAIASQSGGFEGIGFTIPSGMAVYVAKALMTKGKVERGWLGVSIRDLTPDLAKEAHAETLTGALVADVVMGGPAEKAGLKKNDVVVRYGGKDIGDASTFRNEVAETPIGKEARLAILRNGKKEELVVKIGSPEEETTILAAIVRDRIGAEVRSPTPKEVEKYGLNANQGVVISSLDQKGALGAAGFEVGDMIIAIDNQPVEGVDGFIGLVSALPPNQKVAILALDHRTGNTGSILVTVK
jgi:serine protease Do